MHPGVLINHRHTTRMRRPRSAIVGPIRERVDPKNPCPRGPRDEPDDMTTSIVFRQIAGYGREELGRMRLLAGGLVGV